MERGAQIICEGLKKINDLEKGIYKKNNDNPVDFHRIVLDGINKVKQMESLCIDKHNSNILLLENNKQVISNPSSTITPSSLSSLKSNTETKQDIWDLIDEIKTETASSSISRSDKVPHCVLCGPEGKLIENQNSIVCSKCGAVNEEFFDSGPEWRQYNNDDSRSDTVGRCGCPTNPFFPKSSQGTIIVGAGSSLLKRKQKWNSVVYKERSLNQVFDIITSMCSNNGIPKIISDTAKIIYNKINESKHKHGASAGKNVITRGANRRSIIGACILRACEIGKEPRSLKEIARFMELDEKKLTKGIKKLDDLLKNSDEQQLIIEQIEGSAPEDYIRRHSKKLKLDKEDIDLVFKIINNCNRMKIVSNHNPQSIAAGSILLMAEYNGLNVDRKKIADLFGTSDVTIGKTFNKISPIGDALVDNEATEYLMKKFKIAT